MNSIIAPYNIKREFAILISSQSQTKEQFLAVDMFLQIFDEHYYNEEIFTDAIIFTSSEVFYNNENVAKIANLALQFYSEHKNMLQIDNNIIQANEETEELAKKDVKIEEGKSQSDDSTSNDEKNPFLRLLQSPAKPSIKWQKDNFEQFVNATCCVIDFEPLIEAVTTSCGHSLNLTPAKELYGNLENNRCVTPIPCHACREEVTSYFPNPLIRKVAFKIEEISKSILPGKEEAELSLQQKLMIDELKEMLTCSKTKQPLTSAILHPNEGSINEEAAEEKHISDFTVRDLAELIQKIYQ